MNIFVLDTDPIKAAQLQCDKHVVKMIVESAQMLSTAHRILDGDVFFGPSKSGLRTVKQWRHPDPELDHKLYKSVHVKHPCTVWTMESACNYEWHYQHFMALCAEYSYRYGRPGPLDYSRYSADVRMHETESKLGHVLKQHPKNISNKGLTPFALAMKSNPECMFDDPVRSYRAFYKTKLSRFSMKWTCRETPEWFYAEAS